MRHILPNRCGYGGTSGYQCVGVPRLDSMFASLGLTCDYLMDRDDDWDTDVDIPIGWTKMNAYANVLKSQDAVVVTPTPSGDSYVWSVSALATMFPDDGSTETEFAKAIGVWFNAVNQYESPGNPNAPYEVPGVDAITVTQLLESLSSFRAAWQAWDGITPHVAANEPVYKTYFDMYMSARNFIDNYLNLPVLFRGFTTMWNYVLMMDPGSQTDYFLPPEVTCRTDFNPASVTGFIDLFGKAFFSGRVSARATSKSGSTPYMQLSSSLVCFNDGYFEPGLIEPSLPVHQAAPAWPVISQVESGLDGLGLGVINTAQWQNIVNLWLNDTGRSLMHLWAVREMMINIAKNNRDDDFTISQTSGDTMWWDTQGSSITHPHYRVKAGTAQVNGTSVSVSSFTYSNSSFTHVYFYLNFTLSDCDAEGHYGSVSAAIGTSKSGDFSVGLGSVTRLTVSRQDGRPLYYLYQVYQERNTVAIELVRTCKAGVLWRLASGASPYKVIDVTEC